MAYVHLNQTRVCSVLYKTSICDEHTVTCGSLEPNFPRVSSRCLCVLLFCSQTRCTPTAATLRAGTAEAEGQMDGMTCSEGIIKLRFIKRAKCVFRIFLYAPVNFCWIIKVQQNIIWFSYWAVLKWFKQTISWHHSIHQIVKTVHTGKNKTFFSWQNWWVYGSSWTAFALKQHQVWKTVWWVKKKNVINIYINDYCVIYIEFYSYLWAELASTVVCSISVQPGDISCTEIIFLPKIKYSFRNWLICNSL